MIVIIVLWFFISKQQISIARILTGALGVGYLVVRSQSLIHWESVLVGKGGIHHAASVAVDGEVDDDDDVDDDVDVDVDVDDDYGDDDDDDDDDSGVS